MITRRLFFAGAAASVIASPAIVRAASLMPVKLFLPERNVVAMIKRADGSRYWLQIPADSAEQAVMNWLRMTETPLDARWTLSPYPGKYPRVEL